MPRLTRGEAQGHVRNLFPAYRVYIAGENVTELVTSVRVQWPDGSPSQATIELVNPNKLLVLTRSDMITIGNARFDLINTTTDQGIVNATDPILFTDQDSDDAQTRVTAANENLASQVNTSTGDFTELTSKLVADRFKQVGVQIGINDVVVPPPLSSTIAGLKSRMVLKKQDLKFIQGTTSFDGSAASSEPFFKWPFVEGLTIFHHQDPVRVAFRDPYDPTVWYWMHGGTVTDINEREGENLQSTVTINSEGVLKDLRYARIANVTTALLTPDQITSIKDQQTGFSGEQLSKLQSTVFSNFLQNSTLDQIVELIIFGSVSVADQLKQSINAITNGDLPPEVALVRFGFNPSLLSKNSASGTSGDPTSALDSTAASTGNTAALIQSASITEEQFRGMGIDAISKFKRWTDQQGVEIGIVGGPIDGTDALIGDPVTLFDWQGKLDHQVQFSDVQTMAYPENTSRRGATSDVAFGSVPSNPGDAASSSISITATSIEDTIDQIGEDIDTYPIRQRVRMLLPANLGSSLGRDTLDRDLSASPAMQAEYYDRLSLLQQVMERIEFSFYDTPRGDIVIEHPLYDFEPRHFSGDAGTNAFRQDSTAPNLTNQEMADLLGVDPSTVDASTPTNPLDQVSNQYQNNYVVGTFEVCSIDIGSSEENVKTVMVCTPRLLRSIAGDNSRRDNRQVIVSLPNLVPLYGFRLEQGDVLGQITTAEAARLWGHVMLNRMNADIVSIRLPSLPNWCSWPNRPHYVQARNMMAVTKSVSHTIAWQQSCDTEYGLNHCKFWDGRTQPSISASGSFAKPIIPRFVPFGGINARPFNYEDILVANTDQNGQTPSYNAANKAPQ